MRQIKVLAGAGALIGAALVGGTLISAALAAPAESDATTTTVSGGVISSDYVDAYLDALAAELGVDRAALGPAAQTAANAAIDAAVAAGDIDATRGEELKAEIAALENPENLLVGRVLGGHHGWHGGPGIGLRFGETLDAAASALGLTADEVVSALRDGTSLQALAEQQGVDYATVSDAVLAAVQTALDERVAAGDITQERADEVIAKVTTWLENGGEASFGRFGFGHRH